MRVALVSHYYPAHRGGVERVAGELAARLARGGAVQIEWHASDCDPAPPAAPALASVPAASCNALERGTGLPYPLWSPSALRRLARAVRTADVVHVHDFVYLPCLAAFLAARRARRPVLVTQHVGFVPFRNPLLRALLGAANRVIGAWVLGRATRVVFESASVQGYFSRFARFRAAPALVPNGVDTAKFVPASDSRREEIRQGLGVDPGTPLLLFVGRFVEKKGLPVLRELTARIPHARWLLAGWGPIDPAAWHRSNVTVVRQPSIDELIPLYQAADLLVLPSVGEGIPLVIQESMACGTPALVGEETAAGCPEAGELLLREPAGDSGAAERWAARIRALTETPEPLRALRQGVAQRARSAWSWERCTERYLELLRACADHACA